MRPYLLVLVVGCGGAGSSSRTSASDDEPFDPAYAAIQSEFCTGDHRVDRVDRVSVCHDASRQRYTSSTRRRSDGWWSSRDTPLALDENTHLDADLAAGVRTLCAGQDDPQLAYPSLHRDELGWPIMTCFATPELVLYRGDDSIVLPRPVAPELAEVYWIVGVHDFGRRVVFDDDADAARE